MAASSDQSGTNEENPAINAVRPKVAFALPANRYGRQC